MASAHSLAGTAEDGAQCVIKRRVALLGDAFVDVQVGSVRNLPAWGSDVDCESVRLLPGGSCGNTARQLGSLGGDELDAYFFTCVGDDEMGRHYTRTLAEEGCIAQPERTLCTLPETPQSCCVILSGPSDRAMCSCYASVHGVAMHFFEDVLLDGEPWALVHLGGYFNCIGLHDDATLRVLETLKAGGALLSMDPQHDCSGKWAGEGGHLARLLPLLDIFMPNEAELFGMTGAHTLEEGLTQLAAAQPHLLIVNTLGADGLRAARGEERWSVPALPISAFVDATGAGDACAAGFLAQLLRDPCDVEAALRCGAAAGALCVTVAGACELPLLPDRLAAALADGAV